MELGALLAELDAEVREGFERKPEVSTAWDGKIDSLPIEARKWIQIPDVVAVVADLKNSTKMGTGKHAASTASIYQASTGGVVRIFNAFSADFIQIQGDGAFGLFWGEGRYRRAICSAITAQAHGGSLTRRLESKWPDAPTTGLKVGVAAGRTLVKRIGTPRNPSQQEPVWAGRAVNYASKAAQCADRHQLVVTASVWNEIKDNAYLTFSCDCRQPVELWNDMCIDRLPEGDNETAGRVLEAAWCDVCGPEFCAAVMAGETVRSSVSEAVRSEASSRRAASLREVRKRHQKDLRSHRRGI